MFNKCLIYIKFITANFSFLSLLWFISVHKIQDVKGIYTTYSIEKKLEKITVFKLLKLYLSSLFLTFSRAEYNTILFNQLSVNQITTNVYNLLYGDDPMKQVYAICKNIAIFRILSYRSVIISCENSISESRKIYSFKLLIKRPIVVETIVAEIEGNSQNYIQSDIFNLFYIF